MTSISNASSSFVPAVILPSAAAVQKPNSPNPHVPVLVDANQPIDAKQPSIDQPPARQGSFVVILGDQRFEHVVPRVHGASASIIQSASASVVQHGLQNLDNAAQLMQAHQAEAKAEEAKAPMSALSASSPADQERKYAEPDVVGNLDKVSFDSPVRAAIKRRKVETPVMVNEVKQFIESLQKKDSELVNIVKQIPHKGIWDSVSSLQNFKEKVGKLFDALAPIPEQYYQHCTNRVFYRYTSGLLTFQTNLQAIIHTIAIDRRERKVAELDGKLSNKDHYPKAEIESLTNQLSQAKLELKELKVNWHSQLTWDELRKIFSIKVNAESTKEQVYIDLLEKLYEGIISPDTPRTVESMALGLSPGLTVEHKTKDQVFSGIYRRVRGLGELLNGVVVGPVPHAASSSSSSSSS